MHRARIGQRIAPAHLAELDETGGVRTLHTETLFAGCKALVIGVPGAFTPICTHQHLPDFIARAAQFRQAGYSKLICITPSDPFALAAWAREIDPERRLRFLSDGNLDFTRAMGLSSMEHALFLGERSHRYVMAVENAVIMRLGVEPSVLNVTCTSADDVLLD